MAENKKDSFTFSDKIKNSKPAVNPFAKKGASKIGNNGKPKQTLFERTRRDAPFFVAAAAALLMLPFLYKYSGTVNDDVIVPPGSEDSVFDPERFGFSPSAEDPTGQIAQLAGRDPLSLIKGWGNPEEEQAEPVASYDRDGFDNSDYTPSRRVDTPNYRQSAPAATRAAFQRQATKIKELGGASLNLRGGGGSGNRFGGAQLKAAAKQSSASRPRQGAKPVSLTPLRAAGSPSRSYFGQGGAAQARASRDAMSKANAAEALRDAMFAPVENGRVGGLGEGLFAAGGGPGKFDRNMDFKGIEPWWWDMMKQQEMKKWEWEYFLWRKNLVEPLIKALAEVLATFGKGLACCVLTGKDNCEMGAMWGSDATAGDPGGCKIHGKTYHSAAEWNEEYPNQKVTGKFKDWCKDAKNGGAGEWKSGEAAHGKLGPVGQRMNCLGASFKGKKELNLKDRFNCKAVDTTHNFELQATGAADNWKMYHAVVVKNRVPFQVGDDATHYLCVASNRSVNQSTRSGMMNVEEGTGDPTKPKYTTHKSSGTATHKEKDYLGRAVHNEKNERSRGLVAENDNDACVIYVAEGRIFDWDTFKARTIDLLNSMVVGKAPDGTPMTGEKAFGQLQLSFIEGYAMKQSLAANSEWIKGKGKRNSSKGNSYHRSNTIKRSGTIDPDVLPMTYVDFESTYILRRNNAQNDNTWREKHRNFADTYSGQDGSTRTTLANDGKENAIRTSCQFAAFRVTAEVITDGIPVIASQLTFKKGVHGDDGSNIRVIAKIPGVGEFIAHVDPNTPVTDDETGGSSSRWILNEEDTKKVREHLETLKNTHPGEDQKIEVQWEAQYGGMTSKDEENHTEAIEPPAPTITNPCEPVEITEADGCKYIIPCNEETQTPDPDHKYPVDPNCGRCPAGETEYKPIKGQQCRLARSCQEDGKWSEWQIEPGCAEPACREGDSLPVGKTNGCDRIMRCEGGEWKGPYKEREDCPDETKVTFFKKISKIPAKSDELKNPKIRLDLDQTTQPLLGNCFLDQAIGTGRQARVIAQQALAVSDNDVKQVMARAKKVYEENAENSTITYDEKHITIAELVDAMAILAELDGANEVPMNAACMLGKSIGMWSIDPHVSTYQADGKTIVLDNMFGAFAAYMGPDSSFFPRNMTVFYTKGGVALNSGKKIADPRFAGCGGTQGKTPTAIGPRFHYGHYNWNRKELGDQAPGKGGLQNDREPYEQVLNTGIWKGAPLQPIADAVGWTRKTTWRELTGKEMTNEEIIKGHSMDGKNRTQYTTAYKKVLFDLTSSCGLTGYDIAYNNVKQYLEAVCKPNAVSKKPGNAPAGQEFLCSGQFAADTTERSVSGRNVNYDEDTSVIESIQNGTFQ